MNEENVARAVAARLLGFHTLLRESEQSKRGREVLGNHGHRQLERIGIGRYGLSVQASKYNYCSPRMTLDDLSLYEAWEVAVFVDDEWAMPSKNPEIFDGIIDEGDWEDFASTAVGGYVPTHKVQALYERLLELSAREGQ